MLVATADTALRRVLYLVVWVFIVALVVRALLSWFPAAPGSTLARRRCALWTGSPSPCSARSAGSCPPCGPGASAIDLSFIIVFLGIQIVVDPDRHTGSSDRPGRPCLGRRRRPVSGVHPWIAEQAFR